MNHIDLCRHSVEQALKKLPFSERKEIYSDAIDKFRRDLVYECGSDMLILREIEYRIEDCATSDQIRSTVYLRLKASIVEQEKEMTFSEYWVRYIFVRGLSSSAWENILSMVSLRPISTTDLTARACSV